MTVVMPRVRYGRVAALVAIVATGTVMLIAPPALAWSEQANWSNVTVSCNHGTYQYTRNDLHQLIASTFYVAQTADPDNVVGEYHLQSSQGNNTGAKVAANGQVVSWNSVLPSTYTVWHTAHTSVNCNGPLPGNGNTLVSGWARYN